MEFITVAITVIAAILNLTDAQIPRPFGMGNNIFGLGQNMRGMFGSNMLGANLGRDYMTCIGTTSADDDLRVTFEEPRTTRSLWSRSPNSNSQAPLEMSAKITASANSQIQGTFQLLITEFGSIEGYCDANDLGKVISSSSSQNAAGQTSLVGMNFWRGSPANNNQRLVGIIGKRFDLFARQTVSMSDTVKSIKFDDLAGYGIALCPANQLIGNQCINSIPLCCTITKDSTPADHLPRSNNAMQGAGFGGSMGMGGGLGAGFDGLGNGIGNGLGNGLGSGIGGSIGGGIGSNMGSGIGAGMGQNGQFGSNVGAQQPSIGNVFGVDSGFNQNQQPVASAMIFPGNGRK